MFSKKAAIAAIASVLLTVAVPAVAQTADALVKRYTDLAGSENNAKALVTGLRDSSEVKLTTDKTTTTFDPPTQKMGYGNIDNALALAEASLSKQGIANPTHEQLKTALMPMLQMRADGMGWGQIAQSMGFKLGELKRSPRAEGTASASKERIARNARVESGRPDKPERPAKPERPERPAR